MTQRQRRLQHRRHHNRQIHRCRLTHATHTIQITRGIATTKGGTMLEVILILCPWLKKNQKSQPTQMIHTRSHPIKTLIIRMVMYRIQQSPKEVHIRFHHTVTETTPSIQATYLHQLLKKKIKAPTQQELTFLRATIQAQTTIQLNHFRRILTLILHTDTAITQVTQTPPNLQEKTTPTLTPQQALAYIPDISPEQAATRQQTQIPITPLQQEINHPHKDITVILNTDMVSKIKDIPDTLTPQINLVHLLATSLVPQVIHPIASQTKSRRRLRHNPPKMRR